MYTEFFYYIFAPVGVSFYGSIPEKIDELDSLFGVLCTTASDYTKALNEYLQKPEVHIHDIVETEIMDDSQKRKTRAMTKATVADSHVANKKQK